MSTAITTKTNVIVTRLGDFWVSQEQADKIMAVKEADPSASIQLDGNHISAHSIDGVLTARAYDTLQKKRRGAWQCKYRCWHEKFEQCAHHLDPRRG